MEAGKRVPVNQIPGALVLYDDGSVERLPSPAPLVPASSQFVNGVASKDVCIHAGKGTWVRIFLPHDVAQRNFKQGGAGGVPLVLHFHGGGMCLSSPANAGVHNLCSRMAVASSSIWISVAYRLAPEHRLPAQYQDCYEALCWLRSHFATTKHPSERIQMHGKKDPWEMERDDAISDEKEPWLIQHGDAARVFCTGDSAGATILHFVGLQIVKQEWSPLCVRGLMFVDLGVFKDPIPEMKPSTDRALTTEMLVAAVRFCLPEGLKLGSSVLDCLHADWKGFFQVPWPPVLVLVAERDLLRDGGVKYFQSLKHAHQDVELYETLGRGHCFHIHDVESEAAKQRERKMVEFIQKLSV